MLDLESEFLSGVYRAGLPDGSLGEWPPHPERIFSALVQSWGDGGKRDDEREALEWLEALPPPILEAENHDPKDMRDAFTVYVPPNDPVGAKLDVLPAHRKRQARTFRALSVHGTVRVGWEIEPSPGTYESLRALAHRVASLGHSSSFVRFYFTNGRDRRSFDAERTWCPDPAGPMALRTTYPGRLKDLERWFSGDGSAGPRRPLSRSTERYRYKQRPTVTRHQTVFGGDDDWFVFESISTSRCFEPDILGLAHITRRMRDALLSAAGSNVPELLSGHASPQVPSMQPHVAILPLLNVGWEHADGELLGLAVCLPRDVSGDDRRSVLHAIAAFSQADIDSDPDVLAYGKLIFQHGTWILGRSASPSRHSLRPGRYCRSSKTWASVTPVQLDKFAERNDPIEEARIIASACRNIGLREPSSIEIHKHSVVRGAPSAYPGRGVRHRPEWTFPADSKFKNRPRRHVVIRFDEEVRGPVILGAGRYFGFGLCLPWTEGGS